MNQMADNWWEIIEISIITLAFTANVPNQWGNNMNFVLNHTWDTILCTKYGCMMQMMKFWQMPLLLLPMSQDMGGIVEIFVFDHTYDTIFVWSMVNEGFYDENDEISKNAIAFTADEPKIWGK